MDEFFDVVDEDDNVVGRASRRECHEKKLLHRSVMFFIFDKKGWVLVNRRSSGKEFFPSRWSIVLGGHLTSGESYENAAAREVKEEAGLTAKPFYMGAFKKRLPEERENVRVYGVEAGRAPVLDSKEIEEGSFVEPGMLEGMVSELAFIPETGELLRILKAWITAAKP